MSKYDMTKNKVLAVISLLVCFVLGTKRVESNVASPIGTLPLGKCHSHNDYEQPQPFFGAYDAGFCSIEADIWLINGTWLVAHSFEDISPQRTLDGMYLKPLLAALAQGKGYLHPASKYLGGCHPATLLIDMKETPNVTAEELYFALEATLKEVQVLHPGTFVEWRDDGSQQQGAMQVIVSGLTPDPAVVLPLVTRLSALDGRISDLLLNRYPPSVIPLISQGWCCGESPDDVITDPTADPTHPTQQQMHLVRGYVRAAREQGRQIRFWRTPDTPDVWQMMFDIGLDYINTDDLQGMKHFVTQKLNMCNSQGAVA